MTDQTKLQIIDAVKNDRLKYQTDADHARKFGIDASRYNQVFKAGKIDRLLSDDLWVSIAMDLRLKLSGKANLVIARTPTFDYITAQLRECQSKAMSLMFCDECDIGKTVAAEEYMRNNTNVVYIDCSQNKVAKHLIIEIARLFGIDIKGTYKSIYKRLVFYLNNVINNPLIILDEYGDLKQEAYLELKALWNATAGNCGWYAIGADGLSKKFERMMDNRRVGFAEMYSRFGGRFQGITHTKEWIGREEEFKMLQLTIIAQANGYKNIQKLIADSEGSLRRLGQIINKPA